MGHKIEVGGSATINIDSVLRNVTQTLGSASYLSPSQKHELDGLIRSLKTDLDALEATHPDETKEIADALQKAVSITCTIQHAKQINMIVLAKSSIRHFRRHLHVQADT